MLGYAGFSHCMLTDLINVKASNLHELEEMSLMSVDNVLSEIGLATSAQDNGVSNVPPS